ncbi:MAG: DUF4325 domain-containing protein [Acidiferrobacterales bacterium]|nr:DUF4325 domain-containing protein [Acidiferrobacterales bacterium]
MTKRSQKVRNFILQNVDKYPRDIAEKASSYYSISRQSVNRHLNQLMDKQVLDAEWTIKNRSYQLRILESWNKHYQINEQLAEDVAWREDIESLLPAVPDNVLSMWHYGVTEIFNNAIDHSGGSEIRAQIKKTATSVECIVTDDGVGIFDKIKNEYKLLDERHAVLELSKGKLTTDPQKHPGQGIFFTSRMFDEFTILSGETFFGHKHGEPEDWIVESGSLQSGTMVSMKLKNDESRTMNEVFKQYSNGGDHAFSKTVVPVRLAQYEHESLISRSQAKRLMKRVDEFDKVILDFDRVRSVGQAFADEIFRVFCTEHPKVEVTAINENEAVRQMISRAQS